MSTQKKSPNLQTISPVEILKAETTEKYNSQAGQKGVKGIKSWDELTFCEKLFLHKYKVFLTVLLANAAIILACVFSLYPPLQKLNQDEAKNFTKINIG